MPRPRRRPALKRLLLAAAATTALLAGCGGSDPDRLTLGGEVEQPRTYTRDELAAQPSVTQTVHYTASGVPQTRTYVGTPLQGLLDTAVVRQSPGVKNDFLDKYVLVTGTDRYRTAFALGELRTDFGNLPSVLAYAEVQGGAPWPLAEDGFARVTAPGDVRGGRCVSNVASIEVRSSGLTAAPATGGASTSFTVSGAVTAPASFDLARLNALPQVTRTVGASTYTGPALWQLLNTTVGLKLDATAHNPTLSMLVAATGSDGYRVLLGLGEIDPGFGNQPVIVATRVNGSELGANGFARLVVPNDVKAGRWVSNLVKLEVLVAPAAR